MGVPKIKCKKLGNEEKLLFMLMIHFPEKFRPLDFGDYEEFERVMDGISCSECTDLLNGVCPGKGFIGRAVANCMLESFGKEGEDWGFIGG